MDEEQVARRQGAGLRERYIRANRTVNLAYRLAVGTVGVAVVVLGIVLLPLPGPGWLIIFAGLAVLASEFVWAQRLLDFARDQVTAWTHWVAHQSLLVRLGLGAGCLAIVVGALYAYLEAVGVPGWLPDSIGDPLNTLVGE